METCVLMPPEFSLVMCPKYEPTTMTNMFDLGVTLWANVTLHPGMTFDPDEGGAVLDTLECFSALDDNNVSIQRNSALLYLHTCICCICIMTSLTF